ncbi:transporter [Crassaminicella thermophila]|uniref:Transporter n=1 Tax=Crassaminicella thermophila TaxID=2599308 RepID=A0A5C0SKF5_CRATE|nr:transporter [Crassaminicella thermophila]
MEELKKRRQREIKKKKSQVPVGVTFLIFALIIYAIFLATDFKSSMFWIIGLLFGIVLQRARFCFAASFRDPILVGNTSILKAVIIGLIIMTIGFGIIQFISIGDSQDFDIENIPGYISKVGMHTVIGAILFGTGMVIAGGCVSGTLIRIGEGFILQIVVLVGLIIGSLISAKYIQFWDKCIISKTHVVYIPRYIGFSKAIIGQSILLLLIYFLADLYHKRNNIMK